MPFLESDGIRFHYKISGENGPLVAFQHGLGGELSQPQAILGRSRLLRVFSFDCRGHGLTTPLGPLERLAFSSFADDLRTILDSMAVDKAIVGGISMGAGIALNFATRNPDRVTALILARPAWLDRARPRNLEILRTISRLLREHGVERTKQLVAADPEFLRIQALSQDNAGSILRQLDRPNLEATIATLERLPASAPVTKEKAWRAISVPALVLINDCDALHPMNYGHTLGAEIPGAKLVEISAKEKDPIAHALDARRAIEQFVVSL